MDNSLLPQYIPGESVPNKDPNIFKRLGFIPLTKWVFTCSQLFFDVYDLVLEYVGVEKTNKVKGEQ